MSINITITCHLAKPNPRDFVEGLATHDDLNVSVVSNSKNHPQIDGIEDKNIRYYSPTFSPLLYPPMFSSKVYPFRPKVRRELQNIIKDLNTEVLVSMGVGPLVFTGLATGFSPTILVPQGRETANAVGPYYWTDHFIRKQILKYIYRPMFKQLLNHVTQVWGINRGNKKVYLNLGLKPEKFRSFDWVSVDTNRFSPAGDAVQFSDETDEIVIGTFRYFRGDLVIKSCFPFLEAIEILNEERSDFTVILGSFSEGKDINRKIFNKIDELSLGNVVKKTYKIPKDEMYKHYRGLDVYFNISFPGNPLGGLGTGMKEALATETALITPNDSSTGPADYVINNKENGVLTSNSAERIAEDLSFLLDNPEERRRISQRGRETVVSQFSRREVAKSAYNHVSDTV